MGVLIGEMAMLPVAAELSIQSELTSLLKIPHPIILAGMAVVSSAPLAAAVSNAGGLGVIGAGFPDPSPKLLRKMISELKEKLFDPTCFGVDLLIPQVGVTRGPPTTTIQRVRCQ